MDKLDIATTFRGHLGHLRDISDTLVDRAARACTRFYASSPLGTSIVSGQIQAYTRWAVARSSSRAEWTARCTASSGEVSAEAVCYLPGDVPDPTSCGRCADTSSGSTTDSRRAEADRGRTPAQAVGVGFRIVLGIVVIVVDSALVLRSLGIRM